MPDSAGVPVRGHRGQGTDIHARPAAVLWDMDGTLVDSEKVWTVSLADTARELGGELSRAAREAMVGSNMSRTLDILFDDLRLAPSPHALDHARQWLTTRTGELFAGGLQWRPGALDALRMVRSAGWPTALVTNTGRALTEMALEGIGREHFSVSVCGDEVLRGKPAPDPYLRAAELLGVAVGECLAVEDSPTGTLAAVAAGAAVLVVPCEVPVPTGPGRVQRASLEGLTPSDVRQGYAQARRSSAAAQQDPTGSRHSDRSTERLPAHDTHRGQHRPELRFAWSGPADDTGAVTGYPT